MTRDELDEILHQCYSVEIFPEDAAELIWGRPFDGETEKIKPVTEESSATLSESFSDGTTYTRTYQVFLPTPTPTPTQPQ